jgi:hypothetical protein
LAAVVEVHSYHGATGSPSTSNVKDTEIRHKLADNDTVDLNNPVPIPAAGTKYGWRKHTRLFVASGIGSQIGNLRWFAGSAPGDWSGGVSLLAGTTPSYRQGSASDETAAIAGVADVDIYTSTSPLTVNASAAAITQNSSYGSQDYVNQQIGVASTATSGVKTARTCSYRFDEI